ncbi:ParB/RepB/Spo0J family partition protein [Oceanibaculum pacificum]|uniref:ParB/RepB/Spo0J family partition protein n=1 Tax=Oceanibaculum pacificum TaxID=580166 RepID=UPI000A037F69|nr:ParB/RepB/Spo0J family partition protein [Oceanibaculum pacificum]
MAREKRQNLGRGLDALLGEDSDDYAELDRLRQTKTVPVEYLEPGPFQPRRYFDPEDMTALIESVRDKGVLQPILVRRHPADPTRYQIIAGERRWRATQEAQLHEVPVVIRDFDDRQALEVALVENIQRQDLTPLEEAEGYQRLMEEFGHTQEELATVIGKSRSHIANMMRLLGLPPLIRQAVEEGKLTAGHARALLGAPESEALAAQVISKALNVRETERLVQKAKDGATEGGKRRASGSGRRAGGEKDADTLSLERDLSALLGLTVSIDFESGAGGVLAIRYRTLEQLDDVLSRLSRGGGRAERMPADRDAGYEDIDSDDPLVPSADPED